MRYQREIECANERVTLLTALSHDVMFDIDCQGQTGEVFGDFNARFGREPQSCDLVLRKRCQRECNLEVRAHENDSLLEQAGRADGGRPEDMPADLRPSITVGAAATVRNPVTFDELYQKADEALYVAKRAGKSRATLRILD